MNGCLRNKNFKGIIKWFVGIINRVQTDKKDNVKIIVLF